MAVVKRPFISESGFQSTGFTVDTAGNVTVRTITNTYTPPAPAVVPDFNVEETAGAFTWKKDGTAVAGTNPTITVERGKTYSINLNLSSLAFNIFKADTNNSAVPGELYSTGLSHTNIVTGATLVSGSKNFSQTWQQQTSGANRTVEYFTPDTTGTSYANKKLPVVITLHDSGSNSTTGLASINYITNSILIAPQGYLNTWNVGYQSSKANDIALLDSIIADLENYDNVDTREITIVGYGNGAQLALQYSLYNQSATIKHIICYNGLLHLDQYNSTLQKFYSYSLNSVNNDTSTEITWTELTPIGQRKVLMFNGEQELNFLFNGGSYLGQTLYGGVDSVHGMAVANAYSGTKITSPSLQPNGSNLYDYTNVKMYSFPTVANNFSAVQNDIRSLITTQITPGTYLDVPTSTTLTDAQAQGQQTGNLSYTVPVDAPDSMFYGDSDGNPFGTVTVTQPSVIGVGVFSSILNTGNLLQNGVNANIEMKPTGTGLITINPETTGTINNMNINTAQLTTSGNVNLTPNADVTISPQASGTLTISPLAVGTLDNVTVGGTTPRNGTFSNIVSSQGTLNSTTIGLTTAAQAAFTSATVTSGPATANSLTRKSYVDNTATVLSIALGA